jgi:hypothetical protein
MMNQKYNVSKSQQPYMTPANTKICGKTFTRATGAGETLHWFRPEEITESVVEDHGYGNRSYHGERGTGKFRVFIGDMGGRPYSGPLTEALIVAAVAATFPELAGKLVGVSSRA